MSSIKFELYTPKKNHANNQVIAKFNEDAFHLDYYDYLKMLEDIKPLYALLYKDKNIVAIAKINKKEGDEIRLTNVVVDKLQRGKGYGSMLLDELKKHYTNIRLLAYKEINYKFYLKNGFKLESFSKLSEFKDKLSKEELEEYDGVWRMRWKAEASNESYNFNILNW